MKKIILGKTGIQTIQNAFGALPIQRDDVNTAVKLLRNAYEGGITFFDTARAYSDSEEKLGIAFSNGIRNKVTIATKTVAKNADDFWADLHLSLKTLKTDYIDIYQLHCAPKCFKESDDNGLYSAMLKAKEQGKIRHISITCHKIDIAEECVKSGLYETIQYPFSYLANDREKELVKLSEANGVGFIAMKALSGGLITNATYAYAFISEYENVLPIWGVQKEKELNEWLSFIKNTPKMTKEIALAIERDKHNFGKSFCRGCGYCMPCPKGITINQCARMSLMLRRAPSKAWLTENWQTEMKKIETCLHCNECMKKCPYELDTPKLLQENYDDYFSVLAGKTKV